MAFETPLARAKKLCVYNQQGGLDTAIDNAEITGKSNFNKDYSAYKMISRLADEIIISKFEKYSETQIKCFTDVRLQYLQECDLVEFTSGTYTGIYSIDDIYVDEGYFLISDLFIDDSLTTACSILQKQIYNEALAWYILAVTSLTSQEIVKGQVLKQSQGVGNGIIEQSAQGEIATYQKRCLTEAHKLAAPDNKIRVYFG